MRGIKNLSFGFGLEANTKKILKKTNNNPLFRLDEDENDERDDEEEENELEIVDLNNATLRKTGKVAFGLQSQNFERSSQ